MIKALEEQIKDITQAHNKQWTQEKNEVVRQLLNKAKTQQDAFVRDAQEALAIVEQQRDVKENELQGLRAELAVRGQTESDVARRTKAQAMLDSKA